MNKYERLNKEALKKIKEKKRVSLIKIIRLKCLECSNFDGVEVKECPVSDCILYHYRMGKNPVPKKISEKHKRKMRGG